MTRQKNDSSVSLPRRENQTSIPGKFKKNVD
jgi:hypothetical protein